MVKYTRIARKTEVISIGSRQDFKTYRLSVLLARDIEFGSKFGQIDIKLNGTHLYFFTDQCTVYFGLAR